MHEFKHPKYYKELRKRNKLDQAISSCSNSTELAQRSPGPGLKPQASSAKLQVFKHQATSVKPQAASFKRQATSDKLQDS